MDYISFFFCCFGPRFDLRTITKKEPGDTLSNAQQGGAHAAYLRPKKNGCLGEYKLNFHCFGGATSLLVYRQHCRYYSVDSWSKLGLVYSFFRQRKHEKGTFPCQVDYIYLFFWFWTTVRPQHYNKKNWATLLRMHNNAVHTRRTCDQNEKIRNMGCLVEYRLNFHCFGGATSLLAYRQHCHYYSVDSWSKLGLVYSFSDKENTRREHSHVNWITLFFF